MDKLNNPHDKYFRASMSDLRVAKSFLQAHLPENILSQVNWGTLKLQPSQCVDKHLTETLTDILYRVEFGKREGYISILVEHQSTVDPLMAFRILSYSIDIMNRALKQHPEESLPLVVPLVFYSGKTPYCHTTDIFQLFGSLEPLAREIFLKPFHLIDVGRIPDDELRRHTWASVMELVQKNIWARDFLSFIKELAPLLRAYIRENGDEYIYTTLKYIYNSANLDDPLEFVKIIKTEISSELGEKTMTLAQKVYQDGENIGLQKGLQKGRQEGHQEGEQAAKLAIAQNMLKQGADPEFVAKVTELDISILESVE